MFVTLAVVFSLALIAIYYWLQYYYSDKMKYLRALPLGLPALPLLGHLHYLLFTGEGPQVAFRRFLKRLYCVEHRFSCIWMGPSPYLMLNQPEDIQIVLNNSKTLNKSPDYEVMKFACGDGLLTAGASRWKVTRRHMTPLFHPQNLEHIVPFFNSSSQRIVELISTKSGLGPIDIYDDLIDQGVRNVVGLMLGSQSRDDIDSTMTTRLRKAVKGATHLAGARFTTPWLKWDFIFHLLNNKQIQFALNSVHTLRLSARKGFEEFDEIQEQNDDTFGTNEKEISTQQDKYPVVLTDVFKAIRDKFIPVKKENIIHEFNTLVFTGSDSAPLTVSYCLLALATHPDIQNKLYNEIVEEVGKEAGIVTIEDVAKLKYLKCVLNETLRWFSIVPILTRTNEGPIKLGDFTVPSGTNIGINVLGMHYDPRLYPDPDRFDPDRFTAVNVNQRHKYAFLPFGGGARNCIGIQYALLSMKITMVHLLREYKVNTTMDMNNLKYTFDVILKPKDGFSLSFEKRKK